MKELPIKPNLMSRIAKFFYEKTAYFHAEQQLNQLANLNIELPKFHQVSADGRLLIHWEQTFEKYNLYQLPKSLKEIFSRCVIEKEIIEPNFDFSLLNSLSNSK